MQTLDWNQFDTVLLDMDGTLLDLHFDHHFWMHAVPEAYAYKNHISIRSAKAKIHREIESHAGTLNWYCLDFWSAKLELNIAELKRGFKEEIRVHPEVLDFLAALRRHGKRVVMVTNAHRDSLALKLEMTEIGRYFHTLISAHDLGMPKEDIRIWSEIQRVTPYDPKRTLLIDDNLKALETAQRYGIALPLCATFVSPKLGRIDPQGFAHFESFSEIMPH
ncbi:MAG: GMP/IMP nucleotidase [Thiotrichales bacterium]|nr:GMP/IMP nucleotidase [Thiotrichales bacterium]